MQQYPLPKLVFVTPSHQYPLGGHRALERRQQLLPLTRRHRFWIVEDDYDSEFCFSSAPPPALRMGYVVVPKNLSHPLRTAAAELYRGGHLLKQRAIAQFIQDGHFAVHIRRMRLLYYQRRQLLLGLISRYLGAAYTSRYSHNADLRSVMPLPADCDDVAIARRALQHGCYPPSVIAILPETA